MPTKMKLTLLRAAKTTARARSTSWLYELVEQGLASPSDRDFAERLTHHRQRIPALAADITSLERQLASSQRRITPALLDRFGKSHGLRGDRFALRQA